MQFPFDPSSLVSGSTPSSQQLHVLSLLRELLHQCRKRWVCDFLFTSEPIHLAPLASPGLATDSVLRRVSITRIEPEQLRHRRSGADEESCQVEKNLLYLPVVSIDDVSLGFGIMDASFSFGIDTASSSRMAICTSFRFAYCASRRVLLEVYDLTSQGSVVLSYTRIESTTAVRSFRVRFHRQQLLAIVRQEQTDLYFGKLFCAMQSFQEELQHGTCRLCGASAATPCDCKQDLPQPEHLFEHGRFRAAMEQGLGSFEGVATKIAFEQGETSWDTTLGSRTSVRKLLDQDAVRRMEDWASEDFERAKVAGDEGSVEEGVRERADTTEVLEGMEMHREMILEETGADQPEAGDALLTFSSPKISHSGVQPGAGASGVGLGGGSDEVSPIADKELKAEIRKQKNRESALRSNMRKKAEKEALQERLKNLKDRAEWLRRRDTQLRHENLRLRRSFLDGT